jgi:hypothetical protein
MHEIFTEFGDDSIQPQKQESLTERFGRERKEWEEKVKIFSKKLKNIRNVTEVQIDVYSARQEVVDYYHYLLNLIRQKNVEINNKYVKRYDYYVTSHQVRLSPKLIDMNIISDLSNLYSIRDELEIHSKYMAETLKTLDAIVYGIKHRITLQEYTNM